MAIDKKDALRLVSLGAKLGFSTLFLILDSINKKEVSIEYVERRASKVETPEAILEEVRKRLDDETE